MPNLGRLTELRAIIEAGVAPTPPRAKEAMALTLLDRLTDWHVLVLAAVQDPKRWASKHCPKFDGDGPDEFIRVCLPELDDGESWRCIWTDLQNAGLVSGHIDAMGLQWIQKRTTDLGDEVLRLIIS